MKGLGTTDLPTDLIQPFIFTDRRMNSREEAWLGEAPAFFVSCTNSGVKRPDSKASPATRACSWVGLGRRQTPESLSFLICRMG